METPVPKHVNGGGPTRARTHLQRIEQVGKQLPRATPETVDVVYVVQEGTERGYCKIGHSTQKGVRQKIRTLQVGNPRQLLLRVLLDGGMWLEEALHEHFRDARVLGEWFQPEPLRPWFPEVV